MDELSKEAEFLLIYENAIMHSQLNIQLMPYSRKVR